MASQADRHGQEDLRHRLLYPGNYYDFRPRIARTCGGDIVSARTPRSSRSPPTRSIDRGRAWLTRPDRTSSRPRRSGPRSEGPELPGRSRRLGRVGIQASSGAAEDDRRQVQVGRRARPEGAGRRCAATTASSTIYSIYAKSKQPEKAYDLIDVPDLEGGRDLRLHRAGPADGAHVGLGVGRGAEDQPDLGPRAQVDEDRSRRGRSRTRTTCASRSCRTSGSTSRCRCSTARCPSRRA